MTEVFKRESTKRIRGFYGMQEGQKKKDNTDKRLLNLLENGCILYMKNGIIKQVIPPRYGTITLKSQDGILIYKEVTSGEKL